PPPSVREESAREGRTCHKMPRLAQPVSRRSSNAPGSSGRPSTNRANEAGDASLPGLDLLCALDGFNALALMAVAQLPPSIPCRRGGLECPHEIGRRLDFPLLRIEI